MGRTNFKHREDEDSTRRGKHPKHSRNMPGRGMKVINSYDEDSYESLYEYDEYDYDLEDDLYRTQS